MNTDNRKLARIERIKAILPHPNADAIEIAQVLGWNCIVKKGEFRPGDLCVFFEVDSFLPIKPEYEFLRKGCFRVMEGIEGFRLRTMKLRGVMSQGLVLPIADILIHNPLVSIKDMAEDGTDLTELLGVVKWDPPMKGNIGGDIKGHFPSFVPKTEEERIQNILPETLPEGPYVVTEKLDGTSFTCFFKDGEFGVCGRNWEQKESEGSAYWRVANRLKLREKLTSLGRNIAIQGELVGPGIQENAYKLKFQDLYVFNMYDIDQQQYMTHRDTIAFCKEFEVNHVPVLNEEWVLHELEWILDFANGHSELGPYLREGIVFKTADRSTHFKAISDQFLLNEKS